MADEKNIETTEIAADGKTQHVVFRSADGHLHDLVFGD